MYALPGQSLVELQDDVEHALAARPPHLSLYQLTLEPNTVFAKYPPVLPDEDASAAMQDWLEARTSEAGYRRYEVSAYATPARECRHNLNYWTFGDYLGVGAGAHSKISFPHRIVRQVRFRQPASYLERAAAGRVRGGKPRSRTQRLAVRIHAERVAADRRGAEQLVPRENRRLTELG